MVVKVEGVVRVEETLGEGGSKVRVEVKVG